MTERKARSNLCRWYCGRATGNRSGICDECWRETEVHRANTDAGYKAWVEHRKAKEASREKRPRTAKQQAQMFRLNALKVPKLAKETLATELSGAEGNRGRHGGIETAMHA